MCVHACLCLCLCIIDFLCVCLWLCFVRWLILCNLCAHVCLYPSPVLLNALRCRTMSSNTTHTTHRDKHSEESAHIISRYDFNKNTLQRADHQLNIQVGGCGASNFPHDIAVTQHNILTLTHSSPTRPPTHSLILLSDHRTNFAPWTPMWPAPPSWARVAWTPSPISRVA